jgi:hypothetical protein
VGLEESLLYGVQKRPVNGLAASHAPHRKDLQFRSPAHEIGTRFVPADLRFHAPRVTMRQGPLLNHQGEFDPPVVNVMMDRPLTSPVVRHLAPEALPISMRHVALLAGAFLSVSRIWLTKAIAAASYRRGPFDFFRGADNALLIACRTICRCTFSFFATAGNRSDTVVLAADFPAWLHLCFSNPKSFLSFGERPKLVPVRVGGGPNSNATKLNSKHRLSIAIMVEINFPPLDFVVRRRKPR